ncbi:MAG: SpoIIIAH-like family protein [Oscillospiraceae bacterium]|nr:SpoIIIAH-like family protein [Oscillospiraceae bacterium]
MRTWKKNAVMASVLVFVCAGIYLNWLYTQDAQTADLTDTLNADKIMGDATLVMNQNVDPANLAAQEGLEQKTGTTDYFAAVRLSRQESRDSAIGLLQEAMSYGEGEQASTASGELKDIVDVSLQEAQIESLVIAKGYADCVAYMSDDGISVAVASPENGLKAEDAALISDIVLSQTSYELADIHVIEVK